MKLSIIILLLFPYLVFATRGADILLLGVSGNAAPILSVGYIQNLREFLAEAKKIRLIDEFHTEQMRARLKTDSYRTISEMFIHSLEPFCADSTMVVWGRIENFSIKPKRHLLVKGVIEGEVAIKLIAYSLLERSYTIGQTITVKTRIPKGFIFFLPIEIAINPTAIERAEIVRKLQRDAALYSARHIVEVVNKKHTKGSYIAAADSGPLPSEIFSLPSFEGEKLDNNVQQPDDKGNKADSVKKNTLEVEQIEPGANTIPDSAVNK